MIHSKIPLVLSILLAPAFLHGQTSPLLLRGARVFTGEGPFREGLSILVDGGKIRAVGKDLPAPKGARILDLEGTWITPGLIDGNTSLGLPSPHENEESSEVTPQIKVSEGLDLGSADFRFALHGGVTTACVSPGGKNVFGGLDVLVKTAGGPEGARIFKDAVGLRITLGTMPGMGNLAFRGGRSDSMYFRRPTTRMGTIWEIRRAFYEAQKNRESFTGKEPDRATRVLLAALDHKIMVRMTARSDADLRTALRLAREFKLRLVLDEAVDAYYLCDVLAAAGFPVIAAPPSVPQAGDQATPHLDTIALLAKAGVKVALQTGQGLGAQALIREAAFAVRGGLPRTKALEAVTSVAAEVLGVEDRVGRLAKGLDADIVVWSAPPLRLGSRPLRIYIEGNLVHSEASGGGSGR